MNGICGIGAIIKYSVSVKKIINSSESVKIRVTVLET